VASKVSLLSLSFPFRKGPTGFPQLAESDRVVLESLESLVLTGKNERVMRADLGTHAHAYVFEDLTPILQARIAADLAQTAATYEPRARILAVEVTEGQLQGQINVDVVFEVNDQVLRQSTSVGAATGVE